uniref:Kp4 domain-containing protein n=1 Tax=Macrostomum lignano TaxID=282301 RepID=A0A1I8H482_9PLAT
MSRHIKLFSLPLLLLLLPALLNVDAMSLARLKRSNSRTYEPHEIDPSLTKFNEDCPNGYIAYKKFNTTTGVFDCAIRTAEICLVLCRLVESGNWDMTNPLSPLDPREFDGWYCERCPSYDETRHDVLEMLGYE